MRHSIAWCCGALSLLSACATDIVAPDALVGSWGGPGAGLVVSTTSAAVALTCGAAELDLPIVLDTEGRFVTSGRRWFIGGVPPRPDQPPPPPEPVRVTGHVDGDRLTLAIVRLPTAGGGSTVGAVSNYRLFRNRQAEVLICP